MCKQGLSIVLAVAIAILASSSISRASAIYDFQITQGIMTTSGGYTGQGYGTFTLTGWFSMQVSGSTVSFLNSSVTETRISDGLAHS